MLNSRSYESPSFLGFSPRGMLLLTVSLIFAIGLVMIFSTTSAEVVDHLLDQSTHQALLRQVLYACAGLFGSFWMWKQGYQKWLRFSPWLLLLFTFLLLLALIPGIGREVNGSRRWLSLAGISLQPSEFVKYLVPAVFIHSILKQKIRSFKDFFIVVLPLTLPIFLILIEPNNGTAGVIALILVVLFFLMRIPFKFWGIPLLIAALVGVGFASQLPYVQRRVKAYLNPELDIRGKGHQAHQAKIAAGSGGMFGKGPGNGWQKLSYLPEAQNDYIGAIYAEEFGFLGMAILIFLYMLFTYLGFYIASNAEEVEGFYLGAAITFLMSFQAFLNLGVVSGLLPSTGLNLPLFSQGGSSLIANLMGIGLLLSISRGQLCCTETT